VTDAKIVGQRQLQDLSRDLKASGADSLRKEMRKGLRDSAKIVVRSVKEHAPDRLPQRGGLADLVARSSFSVQTWTTNVKIRVKRRQQTGGKLMDLNALDRGRVRHPLHGNRSRWYNQSVPSGSITDAAARAIPEAQREMGKVMDETAKKLANGGGA